MAALPLIIVVGGDDLAARVCEELCATRGHDVVLLWSDAGKARQRALDVGATFVAEHPNSYESLGAAGVATAATIIPVSPDDRLNLQVALKARDLNPSIRVVIRQFNQTLGRKIEQVLPNCRAISPAAHAAATYAGAAMDPWCFYALQFPDVRGPLVGFSERLAQRLRIAGSSVDEAEKRLGLRILSVNGSRTFDRASPLHRRDRVVAFAPLAVLLRRRRVDRVSLWRRRAQGSGDALARAVAHAEPLLVRILAVGTAVYIAAVAFFASRLHLPVIDAMYFVTSTMTLVGYGDISPLQGGAPALVASMIVMIAGMAISGTFIGTVSAALTRAQETMLHGLRRIHAEDHVVVCGAGNVGMRVIEYLLHERQRVVAIERNPSSVLLELARERRLDLLTGDATADETISLCDLGRAKSFVATTETDAANLESALGALAENARLPVILRILDPLFARSIHKNVRIARTFSPTELTAPAIAALSRFSGTRGRITIHEEGYSIAEREMHDPLNLPANVGAVPLCVWRDGEAVLVGDFADVRAGDRLLYLVPLAQFREAPRAPGPKDDE